MAETDKDDLTGQQVGHYTISRRLGKGGMGAVYLAQDLTLDRPAAIKVLLAALVDQPGVLERFQREARAAAQLNHPNIVQVYGVSLDEALPYIAMEFVDGMSLETWLQRRQSMPWDRALDIVAQVAAALDCAHEHGIVHRDIKPANILLDKQGRVRVTDFGIAKVVQAATQLTVDGTFIGTPQYMSPEQCGIGEVGPQSDLFSLGVTTYELLSGRVPFQGDTPASLIFKITSDSPEPLSNHVAGISPGIEALVSRLIAKDPVERYPCAKEVLVDIDRIRAGEDVVALAKTTPLGSGTGTGGRGTPPQTSPPWGASVVRRRGLILGTGAVLIALVIGGAVFGYARSSRRDTPPMAEKRAPMEVDSPLLDEFFATNDANGDGVLSASEIPRQRRRSAVLADSNGDGELTRQEMEQARDKLVDILGEDEPINPRRVSPSGADPMALMRRYDQNKDQRLTAREVPEFIRPRLVEADSNRDGEVTVDELRKSAQDARGPSR